MHKICVWRQESNFQIFFFPIKHMGSENIQEEQTEKLPVMCRREVLLQMILVCDWGDLRQDISIVCKNRRAVYIKETGVTLQQSSYWMFSTDEILTDQAFGRNTFRSWVHIPMVSILYFHWNFAWFLLLYRRMNRSLALFCVKIHSGDGDFWPSIKRERRNKFPVFSRTVRCCSLEQFHVCFI